MIKKEEEKLIKKNGMFTTEIFAKTKKKVCRGDNLNDDEYHMVINAWIVNDKNQFLITQRVATKPYGLMWE